jgi:signal transduction histidine kinase
LSVGAEASNPRTWDAGRLLSDVLRRHRAEILERWEAGARDETVSDRIRRLLDWITEHSIDSEDASPPADAACTLAHGPEVGEVIAEYVLLRTAISEVVGRVVGGSPPLRAVAFVDRAIDNALTSFAQQCAQQIRVSAVHESDQLRFLADATATLSASLNYDETLHRVAQLAVPVLADWCVVDLVDAPDGQLRRVGVAHRDPALTEISRGGALGYPIDWVATRGVTEVIREGRPELVAHIPDELLVEAAHGDDELAALRALGLKSYLIVPLVARDRRLGAITLVSAGSGRRFGPGDVELAGELARRAALAVDNARSYFEAQQAIHGREQILATVSHDLRNPLTAVRLIVQMLRESERDPGSARELDLVISAVDRMKRLIDDMLDTSAIQSGRLSMEPRTIDPRSLVRDAIETHHVAAREKRIALSYEIDGGFSITCDPVRVAQVLGNLVGNAIKFCSSGERIHVQVSTGGGRARFDVADTGPGIDRTDLPRIFEPYWTSAHHKTQGSGLGLYICKGIIEAHGGQIWAESAPGEGTRISFTLPVADRE